MDETNRVVTPGYLNKLKYIAKYKKEHCKQYSLQLNKTTDAKYIALLDKQSRGERVSYIKRALDFYEENHK
jgi:hypothetical protein